MCRNRRPRQSIDVRQMTQTMATRRRLRDRREVQMRGTYRTRWAGDAQKSSTAAPRSCESRRSPAAARRLATTETNMPKGSIDHADSVDGRDRAGGARFGALSGPHGWRRHCEVLRHSLPCFHALEGFESIGSVAKRGPARLQRDQLFCNILYNFNVKRNPPHLVRKASQPKI